MKDGKKKMQSTKQRTKMRKQSDKGRKKHGTLFLVNHCGGGMEAEKAKNYPERTNVKHCEKNVSPISEQMCNKTI